MMQIQMVEVYGITVESGCAELLEIVMDFGGCGNSHKCEQAEAALEKLGKRGAISALKHIVKAFSGCGNSHKCKLAERALELM